MHAVPPLLLALVGTVACGGRAQEESPPQARQGHPQEPPVSATHAPGDSHEHAHTNRLAEETSPYLLQHAHNPVDWYPWGPEALALAKEQDKPIFLSVGYSACHWCHVMERESFEDEQVAELMNQWFVCIKVDREERPDIDEIYMKATQAMTGSGGWPMSVWMTPDLQPFLCGTYFPPTRNFGRPSFRDVLAQANDLWTNRREQAVDMGRRLAEAIARETYTTGGDGELSPDILDRSLGALTKTFDPRWGGFGDAPKFPHAMDIRITLRHWLRTGDPSSLQIVTTTLDRMADGGIYDHLGGGFARYSTDEMWLIPHFEKMLYDNAQLVPVYVEAYLVTGNEHYARVARECCDWVLREMVTPEGGFASTLDADSEGEEGKFYLWTPEELASVLGPKEGAWAAAWWGVTDEGNYREHMRPTGKSALWRHQAPQEVADGLHVKLEELESAMERARTVLFESREERVPPGKDDKVLASWNGLMISALAQTWQVLGDDRYLDAARNAANYVLGEMRQEDGRLFATARGGRAHLNAYLDDYAFMIQGLVDLYESDFDTRWLREALALNQVLDERFRDHEGGGWFTTGKDHEKLIARLKAPMDGALPSGNGVQVLNLLRLAELTGEREHAVAAQEALQSLADVVDQYPQAFSTLLYSVDLLAVGAREIVIAGDPADAAVQELLATVRGTFLPQRVVALAGPGADTELIPLLDGKTAEPGKARAFVCRNYTCKLPVDDAAALKEQLTAK